MSARPHGRTRAGAWRGGCHSERSAIAAVTKPAIYTGARLVRGSAHREEDGHSCATHCLNIGMVFGKRTLHSGGLSHQNRTTDVHCSLPRRAHLHRLRLRPWSPSTRQNRAGPARANSLQPRWHRMPSTADIRPIVAPPSCFRRKAASVGTPCHHQPPFGHQILPWLSVRPASLEYRK